MVHLNKARPDNGHFSTSEVRKRDQPCLSTSRQIALPKDSYQKPPNLAAGFSSLDISCEGPIRANLVADNITTNSFRIGVETWGKSTLFEASVTWIEHKANAKACIFGQFDTDDAPESSPKAMANARTTKQHAGRKGPFLKAYDKRLSFPTPFEQAPEVICWLNRLDMSSGADFDYKICALADDVHPEGFVGRLKTWDDGELNGAAMCWIAFPKSKRSVDSGRFSTSDARKRTDPRPKTSARVNFQRRLDTVPTVLAALNSIDAAGNSDLRVKLSITEVDRDGFTWTLETWNDSTLYAAGASWIALGFA